MKYLISFLLFVNLLTSISNKDVIIIGAGVSGIIAGSKLQEEGYNVTILEARDRLGGRLWSDKFSFDYTVDLGASWIHGAENNLVFDLAKKQSAFMKKFDYTKIAFHSTCILDLSGAYFKYIKYGEEFLDYLNERVAEFDEDEDYSVFDILSEYIEENEFNEEIKTYLFNNVYANFEDEYGARIETLSAASYDDQLDITGGDYLMLDGYFNIFRPFAEELNYQLNSYVVSVDQELIEDKVVVTLNNDIQYTADIVIVTVPLGVLKNNIISFVPELSENKQTAIKALGFETLEKIFVEFTEAFWEDADVIQILNNPISPLSWIVNLKKFTGKNTLLFVIGGGSKYWENYYELSKEEVKDFIISELTKIYPNKNIQIKKLENTKWLLDPYSYGAYSSYAVNSDSSMVKEFTKNEERVFFAGEHTNYEYKESVQGAFMSGLRVAEQIKNSKY